MRNFIHINLCITLIAAQLLFVLAVDKTGNRVSYSSPLSSCQQVCKLMQILCSVIAVILEYLFLASFMWMLMEGVVLYVLLVVVFIQGKEKKYTILFTVLSYGMLCTTKQL